MPVEFATPYRTLIDELARTVLDVYEASRRNGNPAATASARDDAGSPEPGDAAGDGTVGLMQSVFNRRRAPPEDFAPSA